MVNQQNLTVSNLLHISDLLSCIFVNFRDFPLIRVQPVSRKGTHFNPICQKPSKEKDISYRISAIWNLALSVRGVIRDSVYAQTVKSRCLKSMSMIFLDRSSIHTLPCEFANHRAGSQQKTNYLNHGSCHTSSGVQSTGVF